MPEERPWFGKYRRYADDLEHVGCPRAASDMTPCIARDGALALADDQRCAGCGAQPFVELTEAKRVANLTDPSRRWGPGKYADQLRDLVRRHTAPSSNPAPEKDK